MLTLNPDVSDVVDRFSMPIADNLRLLVMGGVTQAGSGCLCAEYTLLTAILRHLRLLKDDIILLDTRPVLSISAGRLPTDLPVRWLSRIPPTMPSPWHGNLLPSHDSSALNILFLS